jgi:hypothetical protein
VARRKYFVGGDRIGVALSDNQGRTAVCLCPAVAGVRHLVVVGLRTSGTLCVAGKASVVAVVGKETLVTVRLDDPEVSCRMVLGRYAADRQERWSVWGTVELAGAADGVGLHLSVIVLRLMSLVKAVPRKHGYIPCGFGV